MPLARVAVRCEIERSLAERTATLVTDDINWNRVWQNSGANIHINAGFTRLSAGNWPR